MKRTTAFLLLASFNSIALCQDLTKPVTYQTVAQPVPGVLQALTPMAGFELKAGANAMGDVLVVSVKNMPLEALLDRIAEVTSGTWEKSEGRWLLVRSTSKVRSEEAVEWNERLKKVRKAMEDVRKSLDPKAEKGKEENPAAAAMQAMRGGSGPGTKAVNRLLLTIDPALLAAVGEGDRTVFSTTPTRMQKPLSSTAFRILDQFVIEQNEHARVKAENKAQNPPSDEQSKMLEMAQKFGFGDSDKKITSPPVKALLIAERNAFMPGLDIKMVLFDREGKVVYNGGTMLDVGDGMFGMDIAALANPKKDETPKPKTNEKPIEFSKLTLEHDLLRMDFMDEGTKPPMSAELREAMLAPDKRDPLSYRDSERLLAIAAEKKVNLVANLPDDLISAIGFGGQETDKETVSKALAAYEKNQDLKLRNAPGELIIMPAFPVKSRATRVDRTALTELITAADKRGTASLESMAKYALAAPEPMRTPAAMQYLMLFAPNAMSSGMAGMTDWNLLRLYGVLPADQKLTLGRGETIAFGAISTAAQGHMSRILFGPQTPLRKDVGNAQLEDEGGLMDFAMQFMGGDPKDFREEPTEIMPNGLPAQGQLSLTTKVETIITPAEKSNTMMSMLGSLGANELALLDYMREQPFMEQMGSMMPQLDKVRMGKRTQLNFRFVVAPRVSGTGRLLDDFIDPESKAVGMNNLPADFLERIAKRKEAFKKSGSPFDFMNQQRNIPPR